MQNLKFTKTHEWLRLENDLATVGISDYAQKSLGDVVFVELPKKGRLVKQFEQLAIVESTKTAAEVYSPISGEVVEINQKLIDNPQLVNSDPYNEGWFVKIKILDFKELDQLMDQAHYKEFLSSLSH